MQKDIGNYTVHINRYFLSNWALGIDYYQLVKVEEPYLNVLEASIFQLNFLFFNITITKWHRWL